MPYIYTIWPCICWPYNLYVLYFTLGKWNGLQINLDEDIFGVDLVDLLFGDTFKFSRTPRGEVFVAVVLRPLWLVNSGKVFIPPTEHSSALCSITCTLKKRQMAAGPGIAYFSRMLSKSAYEVVFLRPVSTVSLWFRPSVHICVLRVGLFEIHL